MKDANIVDFITTMAGSNAIGEWSYTIKKLQGHRCDPVFIYDAKNRARSRRREKREG